MHPSPRNSSTRHGALGPVAESKRSAFLVTVLTMTLGCGATRAPTPDGGVAADAGPASDAGIAADGGAASDAGSASDGGLRFDGGCVAVGVDEEPSDGGEAAPAMCFSNTTAPLGMGLSATRLLVRPACTDAAITGLPENAHLVLIPDVVTRSQLWVHLGGSHGKPSGSQNIGLAAASLGYRFISLAYRNETSIDERCTDPCTGLSRSASCEEAVRQEVLHGVDLTPWVSVSRPESLVNRLVQLLRWLDAQRPGTGWGAFVDANGAPVWSSLAVSGFSQGGGMAGLMARDFSLDRAVYFSKGVGAVSNLEGGSSPPACTAAAPCTVGTCCAPGDAVCASPVTDGVCMFPVPAPWAQTGRDTDADFLGNGLAVTRATAASRQFAIVHRDEGAWLYSPTAFTTWGLSAFGAFTDADTGAAPWGNTHLLSTGLPPARATCSEHQSIGADACQPKVGSLPAMLPAWRYLMSAPVP